MVADAVGAATRRKFLNLFIEDFLILQRMKDPADRTRKMRGAAGSFKKGDIRVYIWKFASIRMCAEDVFTRVSSMRNR